MHHKGRSLSLSFSHIVFFTRRITTFETIFTGVSLQLFRQFAIKSSTQWWLLAYNARKGCFFLCLCLSPRHSLPKLPFASLSSTFPSLVSLSLSLCFYDIDKSKNAIA